MAVTNHASSLHIDRHKQPAERDVALHNHTDRNNCRDITHHSAGRAHHDGLRQRLQSCVSLRLVCLMLRQVDYRMSAGHLLFALLSATLLFALLSATGAIAGKAFASWAVNLLGRC